MPALTAQLQLLGEDKVGDDPIFKDEDGMHYFWDQTGKHGKFGPYGSYTAASAALARYRKYLNKVEGLLCKNPNDDNIVVETPAVVRYNTTANHRRQKAAEIKSTQLLVVGSLAAFAAIITTAGLLWIVVKTVVLIVR
jgi:hypothetical protein